MSTLSTKFKLSKPAAADPVADLDELLRTTTDRLDLLLGEWGTVSVSAVAGTTVSQRVNYARSYATLAPSLIPRVAANNASNIGASASVVIWITGEDSTGFTINMNSSTTTNRVVSWQTRPLPI